MNTTSGRWVCIYVSVPFNSVLSTHSSIIVVNVRRRGDSEASSSILQLKKYPNRPQSIQTNLKILCVVGVCMHGSSCVYHAAKAGVTEGVAATTTSSSTASGRIVGTTTAGTTTVVSSAADDGESDGVVGAAVGGGEAGGGAASGGGGGGASSSREVVSTILPVSPDQFLRAFLLDDSFTLAM